VTPIRPIEPGTNNQNPGANSASVWGALGRSEIDIARKSTAAASLLVTGYETRRSLTLANMSNYPESPREAARRFTPELTALVNNPLYSDVWTDGRLSPRDRSIATLAALTVLYRPDELPAHLRRAVDNGLTLDEISALITHVAFYGGFPAAISASMIAADTLLDDGGRSPVGG
jgi:4-carboxymuconolactone decarboxylase